VKRLFFLGIILVVFLWTGVALAVAPAGDWCTEWDLDTVVPRVWVNEVGTKAQCDHPDVTIETWAFVWGWSKIQVENTKVFWEIEKPFTGAQFLADIGWLGVSSNAGGNIIFTFDDLRLIWPNDPVTGSMWDLNVDRVTPDYTAAELADPNFINTIGVAYYLADKIWIEDDNNPDGGYWQETSAPVGILNNTPYPLAGRIPFCCNAWDIYQSLTVQVKQPKGVYYGKLKAQFKVTCYDEQTGNPWRPGVTNSADFNWTPVDFYD